MSVHDCTTESGREAGVTAATAAIRAGGLVVLPTDTVYGIGCDAFDAAAVRALLAAKGRGREKPPPVLVGSASTLDGLARDVPGWVRALVDRLWPGPLTLVLPAQPSLAWDLGETHGTVALRMPQDDTALALLRSVGPMAVTSANRTGLPPATSILDAAMMLGPSVTEYLDAGPTSSSVPSTIIDCTGTGPVTLRAGAIAQDVIDEIVIAHREQEYAERLAAGELDRPEADDADAAARGEGATGDGPGDGIGTGLGAVEIEPIPARPRIVLLDPASLGRDLATVAGELHAAGADVVTPDEGGLERLRTALDARSRVPETDDERAAAETGLHDALAALTTPSAHTGQP